MNLRKLMKTLDLRKLTRIHWSLLGLAVLGAAFLLTTQPARRWMRHHVAALGAALLPQAQIGPSAQLVSKTDGAPKCSRQKIDEVLAAATAAAPEVRIDCSLTLTREDVLKGPITKRLIFEGVSASRVTVDCNDATIDGGDGKFNYNPSNPDRVMVEIRSKEIAPDPATGERRWARPQNITFRNCKIIGSVKVYGETGTGVETTRRPDYVQRVRNNAPRSIVFDHVTITGVGGSSALLYLFGGVSDFQMLDSEIKGSSGKGLNIYLDAESYGNTFRNNYIHATTSTREVMALDGSSYNTIVNNFFSALNHGGIYLYRNCGEGGGIRHSTPSSNQIINNVFYYNKYDGDNPSIYVASRNGKSSKSYDCDDDEKYPGCCQYGSSVSNYDHAKFNVVMQNQIYKRSVSDMIKVGIPIIALNMPPYIKYFPDVNAPNYIKYNETVTTEIERGAGCYISDGYQKDFILDGQFINLFRGSNGEPVCRGYRYTCHDGVLRQSSDPMCQMSR